MGCYLLVMYCYRGHTSFVSRAEQHVIHGLHLYFEQTCKEIFVLCKARILNKLVKRSLSSAKHAFLLCLCASQPPLSVASDSRR